MARPKSIAVWIRNKRQESGLSQDALAKHVGCTGMTIGNWENGKTKPDAASVKKLEKVLGAFSSTEAEPEEQDFGNWLRTERTTRGVTQQQLADAAKVNAVTISMIELGKISRPQRDTIQRLETALEKKYGAPVPTDAKETSGPARSPAKRPTSKAPEAAVSPVLEVFKGIGVFTEFNPHVDSERPRDPGIYVFYDISERPIYVGQGQEIRVRIRDHQDKFWFKEPIVESAAYIRVDDKELRNRLEEVLIKFMKSNAVLNKQKVER